MSRFFIFICFPFLTLFNSLIALDEIEERLSHECGVAMVRLKHPVGYYHDRYGDAAWGVKKLLSLMEKQRNRGQDGAGIAVVKFDVATGKEYLSHLRFAGENAVDQVFQEVGSDLQLVSTVGDISDKKQRSAFLGELLLGHLRYATHSGFHAKLCQPFIRPHAAASRHFALAGNFNMTNTPELSRQLVNWGLFPTSDSDTQVVLDTIAFHLDREYDRIADSLSLVRNQTDGGQWASTLSQQIDLPYVLSQAAEKWDGGYVFCGILGSGESFVCRDPAGIRPGYYLENDEVVAVASERVALVDAFGASYNEVHPLPPGMIGVIKKDGHLSFEPFKVAGLKKECMFERIYFSKSSDPQIYSERKALGRELAERVLTALDNQLEDVIFTFVPNSSLPAFQGLVEEVSRLARTRVAEKIAAQLQHGLNISDDVSRLASIHARSEFLIAKNQRIRTFISCDQTRKSLVAQLYEVTQGMVTPETTLVVVDDSIVRGTTLKESLIKKLAAMNPKKILFVSSAPPVMYPDCYGIDMSQLGRFVAFQACIDLLKERGESDLFQEVQERSKEILEVGVSENAIKTLYNQFSLDEISRKIAELITPDHLNWNGKIEVIYQSLEGLHRAIPDHSGDWVFSGNYPTPGGYKVVNRGYLKWMKGDDSRSY